MMRCASKGVDTNVKLALRLKKSLYGLKQAGRLRSKLLHGKLEKAEFTRYVMDMCLYYKRDDNDTTLVGVYLDDLLVTASNPRLVKDFSDTMNTLSIKDLGEVHAELDKIDGYSLDRQATIEELLDHHGLANANGAQVLIGVRSNEAEDEDSYLLIDQGRSSRRTDDQGLSITM